MAPPDRPPLFRNSQWEVTPYGLERCGSDRGYDIEASRLTERTHRNKQVFYDWPLHMAQKPWIDIGAFIEAFQKGLELHAGRFPRPVDPQILEASLTEARRIASSR